MLEPNSLFLIIVLVGFAGALIVAAVRYRRVAVKIVAGVGSLLLAIGSGVLMVNHYYGYYQTWSQLSADLTGSYSAFAPVHTKRIATGSAGSGRLIALELHGARSHINRGGYVYLPPQYFQPSFAHTSFPVLELLHGSPGSPENWLVQFNIAAEMDKLLAAHLIGPMIVVMPSINNGDHFQECLNIPGGALDETYISQDVPQDVRARFRASAQPAEWGLAGFSSGGYCAANLALRDRTRYGAAGIVDGYFRPVDGPAADALHGNAAASAANDPLLLAQQLSVGTSPLPSLWVSAGSGAARDAKGAQEFIAALHGVESVAFVSEPGAGHNFYAWRAAVPRMLAWMWTQLADPQLRVQFPIAGPVSNSVVVAPGAAPKQVSPTSTAQRR